MCVHSVCVCVERERLRDQKREGKGEGERVNVLSQTHARSGIWMGESAE